MRISNIKHQTNFSLVINQIYYAKLSYRKKSMARKRKALNYSHTKTYRKWSEDNMIAAVHKVTNKNMSQREACKRYNIPRSTLQDRLTGKSGIGTKIGRPTLLSEDQENKLVDYACNRANLGMGFGKQHFLRYVGAYAKKKKFSLKKKKKESHLTIGGVCAEKGTKTWQLEVMRPLQPYATAAWKL